MTDLNPEPKSELRLLSVVIPARDEEKRIGFTVRHLYLELQLHLIPHDIVVVDDGSRDRTWQVLHAVQREIQELNAVQNQGPNGFGRPVIYGLDRMRGDAQVIMMADESDDIRDAVCYWQKMQEGYDCVLAAAL